MCWPRLRSVGPAAMNNQARLGLVLGLGLGALVLCGPGAAAAPDIDSRGTHLASDADSGGSRSASDANSGGSRSASDHVRRGTPSSAAARFAAGRRRGRPAAGPLHPPAGVRRVAPRCRSPTTGVHGVGTGHHRCRLRLRGRGATRPIRPASSAIWRPEAWTPGIRSAHQGTATGRRWATSRCRATSAESGCGTT